MNVESVTSAIQHILRFLVPPLFNLAALGLLTDFVFENQIKSSWGKFVGNTMKRLRKYTK